MAQGPLVAIEVSLRVALGFRILYSGVSNVARWPHAVDTARIVFPKATALFAFAGVAFMVLGGIGLALGFQTRSAAFMIATFLLPTFEIQRQRLQTLPQALEKALAKISEPETREEIRRLGRHAVHAYEIGWQNNLILVLAAIFFLIRGSVAFGLDNLLG